MSGKNGTISHISGFLKASLVYFLAICMLKTLKARDTYLAAKIIYIELSPARDIYFQLDIYIYIYPARDRHISPAR